MLQGQEFALVEKPGSCSVSISALALLTFPIPISLQFRNQNLNLGLTKQRIVEIANYVDKVTPVPCHHFCHSQCVRSA